MKKILLLFIAIVGVPVALSSQEQQSSIKKAGQAAKEKFPSTRFLNFEYELLSPTDYSSKIHGEKYESGRIKNTQRYIGTINLPISITRRFSITPTAQYQYQSFELENVENFSVHYPTLYHNHKVESHYIFAAVNTTYISMLFNKPIVCNFNLMLDASDKGYGHIAANLVGLMVLKKNANTTLTLGVVAAFDKSSDIPVFPLVSFEYKFKNSPWVFDLFFPKQIYFRRPVFANGFLSLGTVLGRNKFFAHPQMQGLDDAYDIVKSEIKTGVVYEHYLNKHFILTIKGGIVNTMKWQARRKNSRKGLIRYSPDMNMYFNVGFSYNL